MYNNTDHFPPWSEQAYLAGHDLALQTAQRAHQALTDGNKEQAQKLLTLAYQYDLYAQHFLSDGFAAGHTRIGLLRTQMRDDFGLIGSALLNDMHNDDGDNGVWVKVQGKTIQLFGDGHLDEDKEQQAKNIIHQAMQSSVDDIKNTFTTGKKSEKTQMTEWMPRVISKNDPSAQQTAPLFTLMDNKVYYRSPINQLNPDLVQYKPLTAFKALVILIERRVFGLKAHYTSTPNKDHSEIKSNDPQPILSGKVPVSSVQ